MPVIEVRGLTKRFGQVLAVDQMSFHPGRTARSHLAISDATPARYGMGHVVGTALLAAATALLAGLAVLFCLVAARTTVARDVS